MRLGRLILVVIPLLAAGCSKNTAVISPVADSNARPDLVIENIDYTILPSVVQGYPSGVLVAGPTAAFTLRIGNVGKAPLTSPFYISNSRSERDFDDGYCSTTTLVNASPETRTIPAGGSIDLKLDMSFADSVSRIFFLINTNDRFDKGVPLPAIPELNYDNNSYILGMKW